MINLPTKNQYSFAIIADPQLIDNQDYYENWENNPNLGYRMYYQTIQAINTLNPAFVVIDGDFVNRYYLPSQYPNFVRLTKLLKIPVFLVYGNHDSAPPFTAFLNAQQDISGFQSLYYSFDAGNWHYISLPYIPPNYNPAAFLSWLAADLQANQSKPTVVFSHYHYLPQGLTQLEYYAQNPIDLRARILDEVLQYGNVKYWYNGHVHNGIQASVKTAWEYRGCKFVTVPTTTIPRNFGEEYPAFKRGLTRGGYFMTVNVDHEDVKLVGHRAEQDNIFVYPDRFRSFQLSLEPRWLNPIPNFAPLAFTNGSFEKGLQGWNKVWRYTADRQPGYITRTTQHPKLVGRRALELAVREKGQHWSNDELTEVYQVVDVPDRQFPVLQLNYYIDKMSAIGGGYIRLHAYQDLTHQFTMIFYVGNNGRSDHFPNTGQIFRLTATGLDGGLEPLIRQKQIMFWQLHQSGDRWHHLQIDIKALYRQAAKLIGSSHPFQVNKLFLGLGAWNGKIPGSQTRLFFDQVRLNWQKTAAASRNDGVNLAVRKNIFQGRFNLNAEGRERLQRLREDAADLILEESKRKQVDRSSASLAASTISSTTKSRSHNIDPLTGMDGADPIVLGRATPLHAKANDSSIQDLLTQDSGTQDPEHFALISQFTPGVDRLAIPDAFANYHFISDYFGFGSSRLKDTKIFHSNEHGELGELLAVVQDVSSLAPRDFVTAGQGGR